MRLLIVDQQVGGGHHTAYVHAVLTEALRREWAVTVAVTDEAQQHRSFHLLQIEVQKRWLISTISAEAPRFRPGAVGWLAQQLRAFTVIRDSVQTFLPPKQSPDAIYIVGCDRWYPIAAFAGSPTWGIPFVTDALRLRYQHSSSGLQSDMSRSAELVQQALFERFLRCSDLTAVMIPDETALEFLEKHKPRLWDRVRYLPDIADVPELIDQRSAKRELGLPEQSQVILSFGSLSSRKGITELMHVLSHPRCPSNVVGLLAGEADHDTARILEGGTARRLIASARLKWLSGFLDEHTTRLAFSASNVAWLVYKKFFLSSGFLWQSARAGLPILACREGLIGRLVERHGLGFTVVPGNCNEVLSALDVLINDPITTAELVNNCRAEGAKHAPTHFGRAVCDALSAIRL